VAALTINPGPEGKPPAPKQKPFCFCPHCGEKLGVQM